LATKTQLLKSNGDILAYPDKLLGATLPANAHTTLSWGTDKSVYFTNERGWRVGAPDMSAGKVDLAIAGCSWAFGYGVDHDSSFAALVGRRLNCTIANLGINSYSIIQILRRLELEVPIAQPKLIVLAFASWQVARCFKPNAYDGMLHRPIYRIASPDGALFVREAGTPPTWLIQKYTQFLRKFRQGKTGKLENLSMHLYKSLCQFYLGLPQRAFRKLLRLQTDRAINLSDQKEHAVARKHILSEMVKQLKTMCLKHNCNALIWHLYEYPTKGNREEWQWAQHDHDVLETLCGKSKTGKSVQYVGWEHMEKLIQAEGGHHNIHTRIHNHPNSKGHRLIAEALTTPINEKLSSNKRI